MPDFDNSNRSEILFQAVKPFLRAGDSVLDVGCGYAEHPKFQGTILPRLLMNEFGRIAYHGIDNRPEVIANCIETYGQDEWTIGDAATMVLVRRYDAVFHLGFDRKDLSDAWKVHQRLLESYPPRVVLLEAGNPIGKSSGHVASFIEVKGIYEQAGYIVRASGAYRWSYKVTQPERRYVVLESA